ncbi:hypothetical protein [Azospirillum brasilense]|uniref:hypothetical protein n=1 Tax=Azospirillum brasilense TaxID=192 RepID=UPI001ED9C82A|nr:hypothetical protein [Azospirillum brasilense]UKJ75409.1 hypothetical protein H1Q64_14205 [Azospirillum brasilense]
MVDITIGKMTDKLMCTMLESLVDTPLPVPNLALRLRDGSDEPLYNLLLQDRLLACLNRLSTQEGSADQVEGEQGLFQSLDVRKEYTEPGLMNRVDISIFGADGPVAAIEAKCWSQGEIACLERRTIQNDRPIQRTLRDIRKLTTKCCDVPCKYCLIWSTHIQGDRVIFEKEKIRYGNSYLPYIGCSDTLERLAAGAKAVLGDENQHYAFRHKGSAADFEVWYRDIFQPNASVKARHLGSQVAHKDERNGLQYRLGLHVFRVSA